MKGLLITNEFLHSGKFTELTLWFMESAKKLGVDLMVKTNAEILAVLDSDFGSACGNDSNNPDFILFWDKDIRLAKYLEMKGNLVLNSSQGIAVCDDKSLTHLQLQAAGMKMPRTVIAPMTYSNIGYSNFNFLNEVMKQIPFPMVVKECFGSFGQQVYLVHNQQELEDIMQHMGGIPMLFQEFIQNSNGRDVRLQVVGNQVVAAMYRYSDNGDFRANISNGGKMKVYEPTKEQTELAVQCTKILGLDFAGVDILFGENEEPIVCEVNSNAHFKNIYDCTGINVADSIMEHIIKKICIG